MKYRVTKLLCMQSIFIQWFVKEKKKKNSLVIYLVCPRVFSCFSQPCPALCDFVDCSPPSPWDSPGKNMGVGYHALLQGIFLTQGSNPHSLCLLHWQVCSLPLEQPRYSVLGFKMWDHLYSRQYSIAGKSSNFEIRWTGFKLYFHCDRLHNFPKSHLQNKES